MADLEAEIPEEIQRELDHPQICRRRDIGRDEQQVDIAERRQHAAPIPPGCRHRQPQRFAAAGFRRPGIGEQLRHQPVHQVGLQPRRLQSKQQPLFELIPHMRLDPPQMPPERAKRRLARDRSVIARGWALDEVDERRPQLGGGFGGV